MIRELTDLLATPAIQSYTLYGDDYGNINLSHENCQYYEILPHDLFVGTQLDKLLALILHHEKTHVLSHIKDQTP